MEMIQSMKHKSCFTNAHCCFSCPNAASYEGIVEIRDGVAVCTYYDLGEEHSEPISRFPIAGREVAGEEARHRYWKNAFFGEEPSEYLWKDELYRAHFANAERGGE